MRGMAFCPAHITGFFKAEMDNVEHMPEQLGSMGAGFSIKMGVTTTVKVSERQNKSNFNITVTGYSSEKTDVSQFVLNEFLKFGRFENLFFDINHEISIPVGYGLGSSSAVALSLAYALNQALDTKLDNSDVGKIAHNAEVICKTGLGDVLASYHGGFEIRTKAGAPGIGIVENIDTEDISIVMICFAPISTNKFLKERISQINGLGGKMVKRLQESKDYNHFQDMSLEFAKYVNIMTPRMEKVIQKLNSNQIKCGVALFGETIFSIIPKYQEEEVLNLLNDFKEGIIIKSELDKSGARVLKN